MNKSYEVNFDGLIGPTHNYAGLSYGNVASQKHKASASNPREAALQGLAKMKLLADLGLKQAVLAPQERPDVAALRSLGFTGDDAQVLARATKEAPYLLASVASASSMWAANSATVSPSADTGDARVHFTPANLVANFHRSLEHATTGRILKAVFSDVDFFAHHGALPPTDQFGDEGAANHTRFCAEYGSPGIEFFVYGKRAFDRSSPVPKRYPARQSFEASQAIARRHGLSPAKTVFAQQNPDAIDAGAFHNDVVAVGNRNVLFHHEAAFLNSDAVVSELKEKFAKTCVGDLAVICVKAGEVSLADAVRSYLFNTQLVTLTDGTMALVAPTECAETPAVKAFFDALMTRGTPIKKVLFTDVRQSMRNGGGPACLRLRVALTENEIAACAPGVFLNDALHDALKAWIGKHYRDRLAADDLADPKLLEESRTALDELTGILKIGSVYPFQIQFASDQK